MNEKFELRIFNGSGLDESYWRGDADVFRKISAKDENELLKAWFENLRENEGKSYAVRMDGNVVLGGTYDPTDYVHLLKFVPNLGVMNEKNLSSDFELARRWFEEGIRPGKMLILVGESASGKTTTQRLLEKRGIRKVVTYTTRPMRKGEVDGVDYHFVSEATFDEMVAKGEFAEHASYRNWKYGTALKDCGFRNTSAALTPAGLRSLVRANVPLLSIWLCVDRRSRLIKILQRGDDIEEAYRRSVSDVGQFDAVDREVDLIVHNEEYKADAENVAAFVGSLYENEISE